MEKKFKITIEGHLNEEKMRKFIQEERDKSLGLTGIDSPLPGNDVEYLLGYAARVLATSISHDSEESHTLEDMESWPFLEIVGPELWKGWKILEVQGTAMHPRIIALELNGNRAIAMSESVDYDGFLNIGDMESEDGAELNRKATTIDEAIEANKSGRSGFEGEFLAGRLEGIRAIWELDDEWTIPFKITLDTETGNVILERKNKN